MCLSVPCVPPVPLYDLSKTIKEIGRNAGRNAPERLSWFVVQAPPKVEKQAVELLERYAVEAYRPVETHLRRHSDARRRIRYEVALLPGYVFVRLQLAPDDTPCLPVNDAGQDIFREVGMTGGLVVVAGKARVIADAWIDALRAAEKAGAFDYRPRGRPNYAKGDQLRILTGVMAGRIAEFQRNKGGRLRLLLEPLDARGQVIEAASPLRLKVKPDDVEPVVQPEPERAETGLWPPAPDITP